MPKTKSSLFKNEFLHVEQTSDSTLVVEWRAEDWVNDYMRYILSEHTDLDMGLSRFAVDYRANREPDAPYVHKMTFGGVVMQPLQQWKHARKHMLKYDELSQFVSDISLFMMMIQANSGVSLPYIPHDHIYVLEHVTWDPLSGREVRATRFIPLFLSASIQWCRVSDESEDLPVIDTYRHTMLMPSNAPLPKKILSTPELTAFMSASRGEDADAPISCASWLYSLGLACVWLYKNETQVFTEPHKSYLNELDDLKHTPLYHTLVRCLNPDPKHRVLI
jgi:hypothetical protein